MTEYMDEHMEVVEEVETFTAFEKHDPVWVLWEDSVWYPAEIDRVCGASDIIIKWFYSGEWNPKAISEISKIKRRIVYAGQSVNFG
jgi:hypothetical protein